ncbi:hypothetical protein IAU60_004591 [Kwoniella sp. DSM 27419]
MAYNYSNPHHATSSGASRLDPSVNPQSRQILFSGLPTDISERDLRELLTTDPLRLDPGSIAVNCLYGRDGLFNGIALIHVATAVDAERVRQVYSGEIIDMTYKLSVSHILPADQPLSSAQSSASSVAARITPAKPAAKPTKPVSVLNGPKAAADKAGKPTPNDGKPAGLKLLARMNKPGQPKDKQLALLDKQKANLAKAGPGANLFSRIATPPHAAKSKPKTPRLSSGTAKVGRAKAKAVGKNAMDVDKPAAGKAPRQQQEKAQPKTQAQLDEEMRAYERARRFA